MGRPPYVTRRTALATTAGVVAGAAAVALDAGAAPARTAFTTLSATEARWLGALAEALVPGAAEADFSRFVDAQISVPAERSLLMLRYLEIAPPYADFYRAGLAALAAHAGGEPAAADWPALIAGLGKASPAGWSGPPAPLLLFAVRADAVDTVYGTVAGFERLGIDYIPHIEPPTRW